MKSADICLSSHCMILIVQFCNHYKKLHLLLFFFISLFNNMDSKLFSFSLYVLMNIVLAMCFNLAASSIPGNETDQLGLLEFKAKITDDPLRVLSSWNKSIHFCHWYGVTCSRRHQRVTVLDLQSDKLSGCISPYIGNLSFLREIYLQNNNFLNTIPSEIGSLSRLRVLHLGNNSLVGNIPANLTSCRNLIFLSLIYNKLGGAIPVELGLLTNLQVLLLYNNNLTGNIPSSLGNLTSLVKLSIGSNYLGGTLPSALGHLKNLTFLSIADNGRFVGALPPSISNLSSLEIFSISRNMFTGNLPLDLGFSFPNLQYFGIADNHFTGPIPSSVSNASKLDTFFVQINSLTGEVPDLGNLHQLQSFGITNNHLGSGEVDDLSFLSSLTNATDLQYLYINGNSFGGVLPESISNLSSMLLDFSLDGNRIAGMIPSGIRNLKNLNRFEVWENQLSGSIPEEIGELQNLEILFVDGNQFTGNIPSSLGKLEKLIKLSLGQNNLQGSIPPSLGKCQNLLLLDISDNNLSGTIPLEIFSISSLSILLYLFGNRLTGTFPMEVGNLKNLGVLDVSANKLLGEIPSSLGSCQSLEDLSMQGNFFHGTIPSSLRSLRAISTLDLSQNNLSGQIPEFLSRSPIIQNLNLSFNNFAGMVPTEGVFRNATATSLKGNKELCGGIPEFHFPPCSFSEPKKMRFTSKLKFILFILLVVLITFVLITSLFFCWLRKRRKESASTSSEIPIPHVSYQALFKATDGFSSDNLIGVGSFGSVYRGTLHPENVIIAVKVFNLQQRGGSKSFITECEALRNIRHRNLVRVITACSGIDTNGNDFKALVYEFMVNGSLEEWLHPNSNGNTRKLSFLQRVNIAIDVACALSYLHNECQTPVVHCDLKPNNVLLDREMTAHVADFGLVKFLPDVITNSFSTDRANSTGVRGTFGYAAPEYGMGSAISTSGDMYSFGILLLEMFSGKRPTDAMFNDSLNLHNYVKMALPEQVADIADPLLLEEMEDDESDRGKNSDKSIKKSLVLVFTIGVACSKEVARDRMNINIAASKLFAVRDSLVGNGWGRGQRIEYATHCSSAGSESVPRAS